MWYNHGTIEYMRINLDELCGTSDMKKELEARELTREKAIDNLRQPSVITKLCDIFYRNTKVK
jgi:hypothetical protein